MKPRGILGIAAIAIGVVFGGDPAIAQTGNGPELVMSRGIAVEASGDLVVVDSDLDAVVRVDPVTGDRTILSDPGTGSGPFFVFPQGIAVEASGDLVVAEASSLGTVLRVDPVTGDRTIVSDTGTGSGPQFGEPFGIAVEASGDLVVTTPLAVFRVDPVTGDRTIVSDSGTGSGLPVIFLRGIAVEASGDLVVSAAGAEAILRVDPVTGDRTVVSGQGTGSGPSLDLALGIAVEASGDLVLTDAPSEAVLRVDPVTGDRTVVSDAGRGLGPLFARPAGIAVEASGDFVVTDRILASILRVDPVTGDRTFLSSPPPPPWTQSADNSTITAGSVSCENVQGITDNSYWRKYDPVECGLTTFYEVNACTFGVQASTAVAGNTQITVNIRAANPGWPTGGENDPILDSTTLLVPNTVLADQRFITATFPTPVTIPAGTCIAIEVMAPNGMPQGDRFYLGSNDLGATAPCYLSAADCGVVSPAALAALGFPDVHYIIDLECSPAGPPNVTYICLPANPNSTGCSATLGYTGNRDSSQGPYTGVLSTIFLPPNQFGFFLASRDPRVPGLPVSDGLLCLQGDIARLVGPGQPGVQNSGPIGLFQAIIDTTNIPTNPNRAILPGDTWYFQTWYRDQGTAGPRSNFSNGCCVQFF